jgi:hypothetical protein
LNPQANTFPSDVTAKLWSLPAPTPVTFVPAGNDANTGTLLSVLDPFPNWPSVLRPQANNFPSDVTAKLCSWPATMAVTVVPAGNDTKTGVLLFVLVPFPNSPRELSPQANTFPSDVNAKLYMPPPETVVAVVPGGNNASTGTFLLVLVPSPN